MSGTAWTGLARRLPLLAALAAAVALLAVAFVAAGAVIPACVVPLPAVLLLFSGKIRGGWAGWVFLGAETLAASAAAVLKAPAPLVVPGAALALAAWDLAELERLLRENEAGGAEAAVRRRRLLSLGRAVGLGLVVGAGGYALSLPIPFPLMFLLVVLDLGCLGYFLFTLKK
jgi:hypothetical protein